jgi:hypothetical protein
MNELEKAIQVMEATIAAFPANAVISDIVGLVNAWSAVKNAFQVANSKPSTGVTNGNN